MEVSHSLLKAAIDIDLMRQDKRAEILTFKETNYDNLSCTST